MTSLAIVAVVLAAGLCLTACIRRRWKPRVVLVECLRFVLVAFAALLLTQPETLYPTRQTETQELVLLVDHSGSMATSDVVSADQPTRSRSSAAAALVSDPIWERIETKFKRVNVSFSKEDPSESDLASAIETSWSNHPDASAIVFVSDGDWNIGRSPAQVAAEFGVRKREGQKLLVIGVGQENTLPDVSIVSAPIPTIAVVDKPIQVPVRIRNSMPEQRELSVGMLVNGKQVRRQSVTVKPSGYAELVFDWQTDVPGDVSVQLVLDPVEGDSITSNNAVSGKINVRQERLRVLIIESQPRWEFRYLRNALIRDPGVEVNCLLLHPQLSSVGGGGEGYLKEMPREPAELASYDVVFLGDVGVSMGDDGKGLSADDCRALAGLVREQAVGLVLMPGPLGNQATLAATELEPLFPVELDFDKPRGVGTEVPSSFSLTSSGRGSLLMELDDRGEENWKRWADLPGFYWHAPVVRAKSGGRVLAVHSDSTNEYGRLPLLVTRPFGAGKVLFMGTDSAWRWRRGVEDRYHYRFWAQVIRWMAYQRNMAVGKRMRLSYFPERPEVGQTISFRAALMTEQGEPLRQQGIEMAMTAPDQETQKIELQSTDNQWGVYEGRQTVSASGEYRVRITHPTDGSELDTVIAVQGRALEQVGKPARLDVMKEVARLSGGSYFGIAQWRGLVDEVDRLPPSPEQVYRVQWWNHPGVLLLMIGGWGLLWVGRKWAGLV